MFPAFVGQELVSALDLASGWEHAKHMHFPEEDACFLHVSATSKNACFQLVSAPDLARHAFSQGKKCFLHASAIRKNACFHVLPDLAMNQLLTHKKKKVETCIFRGG